ncbi:MAG TPA: dTDP-4-dehydrorhamnose reductase [Xanthomonadaceae bacterium]|nr:dTDP-4-dehydrorhamnose reductase [Xanthomonadaceae bacterium]
MRILLLGANGQVGTELQRSLAPLGDVACGTRNGRLADGTGCEIADFDQPAALAELVERLAPEVVVNAAAYTAVDRAEDEREAAFRANAEAPAALAGACARKGALLLHYSTDYVFDGQGTHPYRADDPTDPLGAYGASKLAGEQAIVASGCRHLILRTAWVYAAHGHNFLRTMLRLGADRDELRVVADQAGTPTSAGLIADTSAQVLRAVRDEKARQGGIYHLTAAGATTWHGFAEAIFDGAHARGLIEHRPRVLPITTADFPTRAARPAFSVLDHSALERDFALSLPRWQDGLARVLDTLAMAEGRRPASAT